PQLVLDPADHGVPGDIVTEVEPRVRQAVQRVGEGGDLAARLHHQLLRKIAVCDRGDHLDDAAHLRGQVRGHEIDVVGQVLPDAGNALHLRLAAQLPFGPYLAGDPGHLGGERVELIDHRIDRALQLQHFAPGVVRDFARRTPCGAGGGDVRYSTDLPRRGACE